MTDVPTGFARSFRPKLVKLRRNEARIGKARKIPNRITNGAANVQPTRSSRQGRREAGGAASAALRWASAGTVMLLARPDRLGLLLHLVGRGLRVQGAGRHLLERRIQLDRQLAPRRDRRLRLRVLELLSEQ